MTWADGATEPARVVAVAADDAAPAPVLLSRAAARAHDPAALTPVAYVDGLGPGLGAVDELLGPLAADALGAADYQAAGEAEEERLVRLFTLVVSPWRSGSPDWRSPTPWSWRPPIVVVTTPSCDCRARASGKCCAWLRPRQCWSS